MWGRQASRITCCIIQCHIRLLEIWKNLRPIKLQLSNTKQQGYSTLLDSSMKLFTCPLKQRIIKNITMEQQGFRKKTVNGQGSVCGQVRAGEERNEQNEQKIQHSWGRGWNKEYRIRLEDAE
ncbi:hypothetical protein GWI33_007406 [Rhynchophorus ferrugineus]|uniref:Uncharacterized protein n=1 Tax=Rhynchophorus ferrugineus TaxID=354439 RepID=A0A834MIA9_RHYFE|nr:hypothetical protein GWI33_007406 [Rhynchophorus ferrugineus]